MIFSALIKKPAAFLPVVMSLAALTVVAVHVVRFGTAREADEGTSAHLWQLLMVAQACVMAYFAVTRLPLCPKPTLLVMAVQVGAAIAAIAPVYFLGF